MCSVPEANSGPKGQLGLSSQPPPPKKKKSMFTSGLSGTTGAEPPYADTEEKPCKINMK